MQNRLPLAIPLTALTISVFGATPLGGAAVKSGISVVKAVSNLSWPLDEPPAKGTARTA